jgi:hypothetical protein
LRVAQVVTEGLNALSVNRAIVIPGQINRIMKKILPSSLTRSMLARMFAKMPSVKNPPPPEGGGQANVS